MESSMEMSSGQDLSSSPVLTPSTDSNVNNNSSQSTSNERLFNQQQVNDIIKRAKHEAVERDRRQRAQQPEYAQAKYPEQSQTDYGYQQNINSEDAIRKLVADETNKQKQAWENEAREKSQKEQAQGIVNKFLNKISAGKDKYSDFEKVTGDIEFGNFTNTVQLLAEHVENSADVLYELGKDRFKLAQLESLSYLSPRDAIIQAQRLANSIKENEDAARMKLPNEPLSQMRPTQSGTDTGKVLSVSDFRKKYRG